MHISLNLRYRIRMKRNWPIRYWMHYGRSTGRIMRQLWQQKESPGSVYGSMDLLFVGKVYGRYQYLPE